MELNESEPNPDCEYCDVLDGWTCDCIVNDDPEYCEGLYRCFCTQVPPNCHCEGCDPR